VLRPFSFDGMPVAYTVEHALLDQITAKKIRVGRRDVEKTWIRV
jgi:hypothetical protein